MTLRIGTRKSQLALWQANHVANELQSAGISTEIVGIETKGDKVLGVSIAKIGSKGVFTEELEDMLATGEVHMAVHSAKDLPSRLPDGFEILAFTEREEVTDVIVSDKQVDLRAPIRLGTSSTRRQALLKKFMPHAETVSVRGNLQTRISKMRDEACDALVLAHAGVHRMGYHDLIQEVLSTEAYIPAVGQGALAIETHVSLDADLSTQIKRVLNHPMTESRLLTERAFLKTLDGGCSIPAFGLATESRGGLKMTGGIISLDGQHMVRYEQVGSDPVSLGQDVADYVLSHGGDEILAEIRKTL